MRKKYMSYPRRKTLFEVIQLLLGVLIVVDCAIFRAAEESKNPVRPNEVGDSHLSRACHDFFEDPVLGSNVLWKNNENSVENHQLSNLATEALKITEEERKKLKDGYQNIQKKILEYKENKDKSKLLDNETLRKIEETMSYIIILSQLKLQENVASVIKYRSVQLKAAGEIKGLEGSDILVKVINKRICSNLKGLILRNTTKHGDKLTQTYLSVVEFLLENKLFTDEETLKIFGEERALDILVNHIAGVFHLSQDINALVLSVDLLDFLIKDDHTRNLTFILQSLAAAESKRLLKKLLEKFSNINDLAKYEKDSRNAILQKNLKTLIDVNLNIKNWLKEYNNFRFINVGNEKPENFFHHLYLFHILKAYIKFDKAKLSKKSIKEVFSFEKMFLKFRPQTKPRLSPSFT